MERRRWSWRLMLERRRRKHHIPDEDDELSPPRSRDLGAALLLAGDLRITVFVPVLAAIRRTRFFNEMFLPSAYLKSICGPIVVFAHCRGAIHRRCHGDCTWCSH